MKIVSSLSNGSTFGNRKYWSALACGGLVEGHHEAPTQPRALTGEDSVTEHPGYCGVHCEPSLHHHISVITICCYILARYIDI